MASAQLGPMEPVAAIATARDPSSLSTFGLFGRVILSILKVIPRVLYWVGAFATITFPTWLFTLFSTSLTFTLNFTTLLLIVLGFASAVSWVVRYRYLNMYSRLPHHSQRKEPQLEIFPEPQGDSKPGLSNYLDEFLSAIKVFGYLERPVFHELTRTMQTRKLIAGETLLLEEENGFCLVMDGLVEIFVKSDMDPSEPVSELNPQNDSSQDEEEQRRIRGNQGYQLLTEVKNGAPMSSLFSILSLFTEDVRLRHERHDGSGHDASLSGALKTPSSRPATLGIDARDARGDSPIQAPASPRRPVPGHRRSYTQTSPVVPGSLSSIPPLSLDSDASYVKGNKQATNHDRIRITKAKSAHPDILARATVDTTIAIIPATAFRRLTRVYPKATAHIVQVILTRLQRVTLATGHAYLGLASEILLTEKLMNKYTTYDLPGFLRDSALDRLKEKFSKERERIGLQDSSKGIALHNPRPSHRGRSASGLRKVAVSQAEMLAARPLFGTDRVLGTASKEPSSSVERSGVSAGDLLHNMHALRSGGRMSYPNFSQPLDALDSIRRDTLSPFEKGVQHSSKPPLPSRAPLQRQDSADEDTAFRESILNCMYKAVGLADAKNVLPRAESVEQSPMLVSFDSRRHRAVFNNLLGMMDSYDGSTDADSESVNSASLSVAGGGGQTNILEDLISDVEIVYFPRGSILVEKGERNPGLYYVIDGFLEVSIPYDEQDGGSGVLGGPLESFSRIPSQTYRTTTPNGNIANAEISKKKLENRTSRFLVKPGGLAGYIGTVSSHRSFTDVTAKTDVYVGFLPRASVESIVDRYPVVLLTMAKRITTLLPRLILHVDFALEWVQVNAGQAVYHQGDESDAIYIVLNGRMRAVQEGPEGNVKLLGEYGQGDSVGELEVLTESTRAGSLHAIRDTELAKFPKTLFNSLAFEHPGITIKISKIIASRMRALIDNPILEQTQDSNLALRKVSSTVNFRTVTVLPITAGVPVVEFSRRLLHALSQVGISNGVTSLNQAAILNHLGRHAFNRMGKLKLSQYLADLEEKHGLVLYIVDTTVKSPWTQTCISQADCILLVGLADDSPAVGEYERFLLTTKSTARKELVLLHSERYCPHGLTRRWLRDRIWVNGSHHHIQMSYRSQPEPVHGLNGRLRSALKQRVQTLQAGIQKYTSRKVRQTPLYSAETPFKGDFHRLARRLCGKSFGLVLGGGGARGIAHIGVIRALEEAGIPIDIVGGTSIGAFIGALYAWDADVVPMYGRAKKFSGRMGSMWRFALDLTYPALSYTTGHEFNRGIFKTFGNSQIEDFWLEFYCNTTNISKSRAEFHTSGYVWRYVRASMSLAGLIPPLCDEGSLLLDGGYLDNLTVSYMKSLGAHVIFAVDVGAVDDNTPQQYDDTLSGFWVLLNRLNPFSTYPNPPTLGEIQARLAYVSSVDALEKAKTMPGCRYMMPPVKGYGTLEFGSFDEIYKVGYQFGKQYLDQLREQGVLPVMEETEEKKNLRRTMAPRRASI